MTFGERIAKRRRQLKLTQQELSERLGVSFQAVSSWERDEYLPETEKLPSFSRELSITCDEMLGLSGSAPWGGDLSPCLFDTGRTYTWLKARTADMSNSSKALRFAKKAHEGQTRKGTGTPYISHPMTMACHAFALGLESDSLIAAILLHDVVEDTPYSMEDLPVDDTVRAVVSLLTYRGNGKGDKASMAAYYSAIRGNRDALLIKLLDRTNNVSSMGLTGDKVFISRYIRETEEYVYPLFEYAKEHYSELTDEMFLLKYQIRSIIEGFKRIL